MFYKFDDKAMKLEIGKPRVSSKHFMDCQYTEEEITSIQKSARIQSEEDIETSSATTTSTSTTTVSVFSILLALTRISVLKELF
jgi:hypothetical protein